MENITKLTKGISITGNIKGTTDINQIREAVSSYALKSGDSFAIDIKDSFAMPSAMIGYLMKLVEQDQIELTLQIGDTRLSELLDDLGLTQAFNIKTKSFA